MNVLEIVSAQDVNGPAVHVLDLSCALAARGHRVEVACRPGSWVEGEARRRGLGVLPSELSRVPPGELWRVAHVARERGVDVLHTHMSRAHFFGVLLRRLWGLPCVATAHSRKLQLHWRLNDRVVAVSEATARFQRRVNLVPRERIDVVPVFVDATRFTPPRGGPEGRLRAAPGAGEGPLLGVVASLHERKGLHVLGAALPRLVARWPGLKVAVAGAGDDGYRARLEEAARRSGAGGALLWLGPRADVAELLRALDLFVLPSLEESLPIALLEAMATGLPLVASAVGGIPEAVEDGVSGLLVPRGDPGALADAVASLLAIPGRAAALGAAARARAVARYSEAAVVPRVEAILASVAARGRPTARARTSRGGSRAVPG